MRSITAQKFVNSTLPQPSAKQGFRDANGNPNCAVHAEKEYGTHMTADVSVLAFVKAVFKFDWSDIPPSPCGGTRGCYELSSSDVQQSLGTRKEVDGYDSICQLSNGFLSQVPVRTYRAKIGSRATEAIGDYNLREKPDLTFGVESTSKTDWKWMTVPIEVEKTRVMSAGKLSDISLKAKEGEFVVMVRRLFLVICTSVSAADGRVRITREYRSGWKITRRRPVRCMGRRTRRRGPAVHRQGRIGVGGVALYLRFRRSLARLARHRAP